MEYLRVHWPNHYDKNDKGVESGPDNNFWMLERKQFMPILDNITKYGIDAKNGKMQ